MSEAELAIIEAGLPIYQRGSNLVRPFTREAAATHDRTTIMAALQIQTSPALVDLYCQTAAWRKYDARARGWVAADPPKDIAAIHLSRVGRWAVPTIAGVVTAPTMRPDGSILSAPGYDAVTRLYHVVDPALRLPHIPERPTIEDAREALEDLLTLIEGFPFVDTTADRSVALAALVTPVVRGAMPVAPLFAIRASTAGTGKSYLVDLASAVSTGRPCPVISAGSTGEETEKRLGGLLLEGFPILSIDNLNGELGGDLICQAVERPLIRIRRLGGSDISEIESRATMFATGNGLRVRGDMVRRTLLCTLDANVERPELREFDTDPVSMVLADRGRYVAAALTIVRAFGASGAPCLKPLASFEAWSDKVRSALHWLGCGDPCATMEVARQEDPELDELREVMALWQRDLGEEAYTVRDIADHADQRHESYGNGAGDYVRPELRDVLWRIGSDRGAISTKRLGYWLRGHEGRIANKCKITRVSRDRTDTAMWAVKACR